MSVYKLTYLEVRVRKSLGVLAGIGAVSLVLAACGSTPDDGGATTAAPSPTDTTAAPSPVLPPVKACMISDAGGFDDRSFNETAFLGLEAAKAEYGIETLALESGSDADYQPNINQAIQQDCSLVITVGFLLGDATEAAATANPSVDFSIVDYAYEAPPENLQGLVYATEQSSFVAGYLAAGMTETGTVGTYGGIPIPSVTSFMSGFYQGVQYYNEAKGTDVDVLGWDPTDREKGTYAGGFDDQNQGKQIAKNFIQQGADIIFPVAGPVGLGSAAEAQANDGVSIIWVDTDGCISASQYCDVFLTSVMKGIDASVKASIGAVVDGTFSNELYVGTLANGGTKIAPYNEFDAAVPAELKAEVEQVTADIISGTITVTP
ncbi:MAG: BMP family ABC transporter substrate-binding protein [Candidatus Nanopelagicales bacterium]|nr:BMP family ABC transporter substrate-binding protein [Candidatus Nanopelagicales bacterium]MDP4825816.1 BMP family ABC transporter substrate-binding protein [Candidatus Nanopelagicales bacterium]